MADSKDRVKLVLGEKFGDYTVESLLGRGGMGAVYLMRSNDGIQYAVKVMDVDGGAGNQDFRKRFLREAEFAIKVRHPNLISVYEVGEDRETGLCYLVMDYMPGGSLSDRLSKCKRLSVEESVSIVAQIAGALEVAHSRGVIHRDIKPDNILFDLDGTPKLADMGVAKFSSGAYTTTVTTTGMIIGTPAYMAPEQMMDSHRIDARADIYSLGVVLFEMLTGSRPHAESTTVELLARAIKGEHLPDVRTMRPEISASLAYVLSLMCAPKPEGRPSSPCAIVELLKQSELGTLEVPKHMLAPVFVRQRGWKKPLVALTISVVIIAAIVVVAGLMALKTARTLVGKEDQRIVVVTNAVDRVVVVANGIGTTDKQDRRIDESDERHPSRLPFADGVVEVPRGEMLENDVVDRGNDDFDEVDVARYEKMDDEELIRELLKSDYGGIIYKVIERYGGVSTFYRSSAPGVRRNTVVKTLVLRDVLVLFGLPREVLANAAGRFLDSPKTADLPIDLLLSRILKHKGVVVRLKLQKKAADEIVQAIIDCLYDECDEPDTRPIVYIDTNSILNKTDRNTNFHYLIDNLNSAIVECGTFRVMNSTDILQGVADDMFAVVADDGGKESKIETPVFKIYLTIMQYGFSKGSGRDMYGRASETLHAKIELILKVVDMRTKETLKAKSISRSATGTATAPTNLEEQTLQKASKKVVEDIVSELVSLTQFNVLDVENGEVIVDVPSSRVKLGQRLLVYKKGKKIKSKRTGKVSAKESQVAVIGVVMLSKDLVTCKLLRGEIKPDAGEGAEYDKYIVRIAETAASPAPPVPAPQSETSSAVPH